MSDVIYKVPPIIIEELFTADQARAFAETNPEHVELKGGHTLRDNFRRGEGVTVAVLDTGISQHHAETGDLQNAFTEAKDFTGSRHGTEDIHGHATHCCGIIAADNDGVGTSSILDKCSLLAGKVLGDSGSGSDSGIARGIDWAVEMGADIISLSLGGGYSQSIHQAGRRAEAAGVLLIAAAGNSGRQGVGYPAGNNDSFVSCAAVDFQLRLASFSSIGSANDYCDYGVGVYSTYRGSSYGRLSGTSMATPNLAAVCGAIIGLELAILGRKIPRRLSDWFRLLSDSRWLRDLGATGHDAGYGHGFLNFPSLIANYSDDLQAMVDDPDDPDDPSDPPPSFAPVKIVTERDITIPRGNYEFRESTETSQQGYVQLVLKRETK